MSRESFDYTDKNGDNQKTSFADAREHQSKFSEATEGALGNRVDVDLNVDNFEETKKNCCRN